MLFTEPASEKNNPKLILIIVPINSQYLERGKIYGLFDVRYHRDSKNLLNFESRNVASFTSYSIVIWQKIPLK